MSKDLKILVCCGNKIGRKELYIASVSSDGVVHLFKVFMWHLY